MTDQELSISTRLSCQRALLGAITPGIRLITIGWNGTDLFRLRAYFDHPPTEDEVFDMSAASTEVVADMAFLHDQVECLESDLPIGELEVDKFIVYLRKE
jgi:hypothetical protein